MSEQASLDLSSLITTKESELAKIKAQMEQIEKEMVNLRKMNDQLLTKGIELQGAIKALREASALVPAEPKA